MASAPPRQSMNQPPPNSSMMGPNSAVATPLQAPLPTPPVAQPSPAPVPQAAFQPPMNPHMYQGPNQRRPSNFMPQTPTAAYQASPVPHPYSAAQPAPYPAQYPSNRLHAAAPVYNPNAPRPVEVYHLTDAGNAAIPQETRQQFECDERGHMLWFTTPPLDIIPPSQPQLAHSLKYLARREERQKQIAERKRQREEEEKQREDEEKRRRVDEDKEVADRVEALFPRALDCLAKQIVTGTDQFYKTVYGDKADIARAEDKAAHERRMIAHRKDVEARKQLQEQCSQDGSVSLKRSSMYLGDA